MNRHASNALRYLAIVAAIAAVAILLLAPGSFAGAQGTAPLDSSVNSVLIYSNGMAYVSSVAKGEVPSAGRAFLRLENFTESAILGTVRAEDPEGEVYWAKRYLEEVKKTEKTERYLSFDELLNLSYGKDVRVRTDEGELVGKLMWVSGGKIGVEANGRLSIFAADPQKIETPHVETKKTSEKETKSSQKGLEIYMNAKKPGSHSVLLSYIVSGPTWKPNYNLEIGGAAKGSGALSAYSEVQNNAGEDWRNATLRVAVASPYFVESGGSAYVQRSYKAAAENAVAGAAEDSAPPPSFSGEEVGEQYIYTLSEPVTLLRGERANLKLFGAQADYEKDNLWAGGSVQRTVKVQNSAGKPLQSGVIRVYEAGVFAGEANMEYTGVGRDAEVKFALQPKLKVKEESNYTTERPPKRRETTYTVGLAIESSASDALPLTLRDYMQGGDRVELISSSVQPKLLSNNRLEWRVTVPAGANMSINYVYRTISFER